MVQLTNREELKKYVKNNSVVIVKISAEWCGPCRLCAPHVKKMMETYDKISYVEVDADGGRNITSYLKIKTVPTIISYINGDIHEILLSSSEDDISSFFKKTNGYVKNN
jgi:thiol-disulfide isomerase/thioredoxin